MNQPSVQAIQYAALAVTAAALTWGFALVGSPSHNRKVSGDRIRVQDLQRLDQELEMYFTNQGHLPANLSELEALKRPLGYAVRFEDPATGKAYEYAPEGPFEYRLCAEFELAAEAADLERSRYTPANEREWNHSAGHGCFHLKISPAALKSAT